MTDEPRVPADLDADEASFLREFAPSVAAARRATAACPPPAVLSAAAVYCLPEEEQRRVSAHIDGCAACTAIVSSFAAAGAEEAAAAGAEEAANAASADRLDRIHDTVLRGAMPRRPARRWWPVAAGALAAAAVLTLSVRLVTLQQENQQLAARAADSANAGAAATQRAAELERQIAALQGAASRGDAPQVNLPIVELDPADALRAAPQAPEPIEVPEGAAGIVLVLNASTRAAGAPHTLEIYADDGRVVLRIDGLRATSPRAFSLTIPRSLLQPGRYHLDLFTEGSPRQLTGRYALQIKG